MFSLTIVTGFVPPLTRFYEAIEEDVRISATHISLYMALLQQWNISGGTNPVTIVRLNMMKAAKISARHTYNKCMNNLQEFGYITYLPSSNPFTCSMVYLKGLWKRKCRVWKKSVSTPFNPFWARRILVSDKNNFYWWTKKAWKEFFSGALKRKMKNHDEARWENGNESSCTVF